MGLMPMGGVNTKSFHGPLSGPMQPPNSSHLHFPPMKSGKFSGSTFTVKDTAYESEKLFVERSTTDLDLFDGFLVKESFGNFPNSIEHEWCIYDE
jgi:hypothetical protein